MRKLGLVLALFGVLGLFCATAEAKKPMRPRKGMVKKGQTKWAHLNRAAALINQAKVHLRKRNITAYNKCIRVADFHLRQALVGKGKGKGKVGHKPKRNLRFARNYQRYATNYLNRNAQIVKKFPGLRKRPNFPKYKKEQMAGWGALKAKKPAKALGHAYRARLVLRTMLKNMKAARGAKKPEVPKELEASKEEEAAAQEAQTAGDEGTEEGTEEGGDASEDEIGEEADQAPASADQESEIE